ncbi:chromosome partitioning protein [Palleronia aestuarii]|uniref:Chromosome partitioning protein n=1 Tax=Palleronia aestuarii TaxID=568105 RepID=A0A2W7MZ85_9RHOB|nr:ParA family partition ATPase [Palleronia aestuarii]PZX12903.1 chromosome partitioning protein [Palleronia aestuarii]
MAHVITIAQQKGGSGKTTIAANIAVALQQAGHAVAVLDTDPQGSLGRWFMTRREIGDPGMEFATSSAWGVGYECDKLRKSCDFVIVDTPPKVDSDLRPALRESDLVLVPVATSQVDLWAVDSILDLAERVGRPTMIVLNRYKAGTRLSDEISTALADREAVRAETVLGNRVVYAETLGQGLGVLERGKGAWSAEISALRDEILARIA